ncbi:radical SAM protein [Patescibacteria group bacterium]
MKKDQNKYICTMPYEWFEITPNGDVYTCCPTWLPKPIGNILEKEGDDLWNGKAAQKIRRSVIDGSFKYCDKKICPNIIRKKGPVKKLSEINDSQIKKHIKNSKYKLNYGPKIINCAFDRSCNLSCPSCRAKQIIAMGKDRKKVLLTIDKINKYYAKNITKLIITGSGDPFGSPYFFDWLRNMKPKDFPNLKSIHLHTNGQLFTKKSWDMIKPIRSKIKSVEISIDAATENTYKKNRRGGSFKRLLKNLSYISSLKKKGQIKYARISFVVQNNNYKEMFDFTKLGSELKFDDIYFSKLLNWGTFSTKEYKSRAVHSPTHPNHVKLLSELNKIKNLPKVNIGNLLPIVNKSSDNNSLALAIEKNKKYFINNFLSIKKKIINE